MKKLLSLGFVGIISVLFWSSCRVKSPVTPQTTTTADTSIWTVNTDQFSTSYMLVNGTSTATVLSGATDPSNNFRITFNLTYIPAEGEYALDCNGSDASSACMQITYKGLPYRAVTSPTVFLHADSANQRAVLTLEPSHFYNVLQTDDTITVSGVFRQPH